MKDIVIIGAGGFGREVAMLIEDINKEKSTWNIKGFIDDNIENLEATINGIKVLGNVDWLKDKELYIINAIANGNIRNEINKKLEKTKNKFATLIHPTAIISDSVSIGEGSIICAGNIVTTNIIIGKQVIVNLSSTIGHDAILHDFVTIMPSTNISGHVALEKFVIIGTGTQIIENITVGERTIVGAGSTVIKELPANCTAVGSPAKPIKLHK